MPTRTENIGPCECCGGDGCCCECEVMQIEIYKLEGYNYVGGALFETWTDSIIGTLTKDATEERWCKYVLDDVLTFPLSGTYTGFELDLTKLNIFCGNFDPGNWNSNPVIPGTDGDSPETLFRNTSPPTDYGTGTSNIGDGIASQSCDPLELDSGGDPQSTNPFFYIKVYYRITCLS